jgi:hypothetical protein
VVEDIQALHRADSRGAYDPREVVVCTDSGAAKQKSQQAMAAKHWSGSIALGQPRRGPSALLALPTPQSQPWCPMATFCRQHRRRTWHTLRITTHGTQRKRREWRRRDPRGSRRSVGPVPLGCSEPRNRPEGRRQYCACKDMRVTARQIMRGYWLRWALALFHKTVKPPLGCEDVATRGFDAVLSHVHWVDCADMLLSMSPPGVSAGVKSLGDQQRQRQQCLANQAKRRILQPLSQIGGVQR